MKRLAYVDSSAFAKLLVAEAESESMKQTALAFDLIAGDILETELRRLAVRKSLPQSEVSDLLNSVTLVEIDRAMFREAGLLAGANLRSLDALHLSVALRLGLKTVLTLDSNMTAAANALGFTVLAPSQ